MMIMGGSRVGWVGWGGGQPGQSQVKMGSLKILVWTPSRSNGPIGSNCFLNEVRTILCK